MKQPRAEYCEHIVKKVRFCTKACVCALGVVVVVVVAAAAAAAAAADKKACSVFCSHLAIANDALALVR